MKAPLLLLFLTASLTACSGEETEAPAETPSSAGETSSTTPRRPREGGGERPTREAESGVSDEARPVDPASTGRLAGVVLFAGDPPKRKSLAMGTEPACNTHATAPLTESVVIDDGKLRDVFVYIKRGHEGWIPPAPPDVPVVLAQEGCIYTPHVLAVQTGQQLLVHNGDDTTHNVNMKAKRNGINGNFTQGRKQADLEFVFERREHSVPFKCDIHPWMGAWVHVQDHPWFTVSAADGTFAIEGVPAGDYTLEALHPELGKQRAEVTVVTGQTAQVGFSFED